jgi:hypothetical protein
MNGSKRVRTSTQSRRLHRAVAAASSVLLAVAAEGHHSISAVYDGSQQRTIEGVVAEFQFVNPHPFVIVTVTPASAEAEAWRLEMDNRFELSGIGMTADSLKQGDVVVVTGSAGRVEPRTLYVRQLDRPADGFRYEQVGSRPRVSSTRR